jgi:hypothetical protein
MPAHVRVEYFSLREIRQRRHGHVKRDRGFESGFLQRGVCEPSVPLGFRDSDILDLIGRTQRSTRERG